MLLHYFPDRKIYDSCSVTKFERVGRGFGVIRSPKTFSLPASTSVECKWWIPLVRNETNKIVIHTAYSSTKASSCDDNGILRIMYMECNTGKAVTKRFCNLESIRVEIMTCGPTHVFSVLKKGQTGSFIVSYQGDSTTKPSPFPPQTAYSHSAPNNALL